MSILKNLNLRTKILSIVILTIVTIAIIIASKSILSIEELTQKNIQEYKDNAFAQKKMN